MSQRCLSCFVLIRQLFSSKDETAPPRALGMCVFARVWGGDCHKDLEGGAPGI